MEYHGISTNSHTKINTINAFHGLGKPLEYHTVAHKTREHTLFIVYYQRGGRHAHVAERKKCPQNMLLPTDDNLD